MRKLMMLLVIAGMLISVGCQSQKQKSRSSTLVWLENHFQEVSKNNKNYYALREDLRSTCPQTKIGMASTEIVDLWGNPGKTNHLSGSWGIHSQWIYKLILKRSYWSPMYLYFENGRLTSWQR